MKMTELLQTRLGIRINHLMKNFTDERVDKNLIKDTQQQQDRAKDRFWAGGCCYEAGRRATEFWLSWLTLMG